MSSIRHGSPDAFEVSVASLADGSSVTVTGTLPIADMDFIVTELIVPGKAHVQFSQGGRLLAPSNQSGGMLFRIGTAFPSDPLPAPLKVQGGANYSCTVVNRSGGAFGATDVVSFRGYLADK